ncbi:MAG TPA: hypothetical protein VLT33_49885 [Labilithrix sp.]|nr:hypothetical protein [Labilithrix sp.]
MTANIAAPSAPKRVGAHPRILAFLALSAVAAGITHLASDAYRALTDSWMAPITLSPDNDTVIQMNVKVNEQLVERAKLRSDVERVTQDLVGVDGALARLEALQQQGHEALRWAAQSTDQQLAASTASVRSLDSQHALLADMLKRQETLVEQTRRNSEAGLVAGQDYDRELQVLNQLRVGVEENERQALDLRSMGKQFGLAASALRNVTEGKAAGKAQVGMMPDVVAGQERDVHVELELVKLQAERRNLVAQKALAIEGLTRMDDVLKQLSGRPLYRAIQASTDVAFVPYTQLKGVESGVDLMACTWAIFACHKVGRVKEVLPGEVVAQDPWAEVSRGQYAILELDDHEAAKEKVLRARPSKR